MTCIDENKRIWSIGKCPTGILKLRLIVWLRLAFW